MKLGSSSSWLIQTTRLWISADWEVDSFKKLSQLTCWMSETGYPGREKRQKNHATRHTRVHARAHTHTHKKERKKAGPQKFQDDLGTVVSVFWSSVVLVSPRSRGTPVRDPLSSKLNEITDFHKHHTCKSTCLYNAPSLRTIEISCGRRSSKRQMLLECADCSEGHGMHESTTGPH